MISSATSICPFSLYSADHDNIHHPVVLMKTLAAHLSFLVEMSQSVEPIMEEEVNSIGGFA